MDGEETEPVIKGCVTCAHNLNASWTDTSPHRELEGRGEKIRSHSPGWQIQTCSFVVILLAKQVVPQ